MINIDYRSLMVTNKTLSVYDNGVKTIRLSANDYLRQPTKEDLRSLGYAERRIRATDFARLCGAVTTTEKRTIKHHPSGWYFLSSNHYHNEADMVAKNGEYTEINKLDDKTSLLCPAFSIKLPKESVKTTLSQKLFKTQTLYSYSEEDYVKLASLIKTLEEVKDDEGRIIYHTIKIGQYPQQIVNYTLSEELENLFNNGNLQEGLKATGLTYTMYSHNSDYYSPKHIPEFEYKGKRYVRVKPSESYQPSHSEELLQDARWIEVSPITCKVLNWGRLPKFINPQGTGIAPTLELIPEDGITSGIPYYPEVYNSTFKRYFNSSIRGFLNGVDLNTITNAVSLNIVNKDNFSSFKGLLDEAFNTNRQPVFHHNIPLSQTKIEPYAFYGCTHIKSITLHSNIESFGEHCFDGCRFKYLYTLGDSTIISQEYPENQNARNITEIARLNKTIQNNLELYIKHPSECIQLSKNLSKAKLQVPQAFILHIAKTNRFNELAKGDFRFFKTIITHLSDNRMINESLYTETCYKFANSLGCFTNAFIKNKLGEDSKVLLCQKACSLFGKLMRDYLYCDTINSIFKNLPIDTPPNQNFFNFISLQQGDVKLPNIELLLNLENDLKGVFAHVMAHFDDMVKYKHQIGTTGTLRNVSWETAIRRFYENTQLTNSNEMMSDIIKILGPHQLTSESMAKILKLRHYAETHNIPSHILRKPLGEEPINLAIERIKSYSKLRIADAKAELDRLYKKQFTYEFLDKKDPRNAVIGAYCDCCANINGSMYGAKIVEATIISPDVQNLIVRDIKGEIVAKGAMYVNQEFGYAVLNDFEINHKYKTSSVYGYPGYYYTDTPAEQEEEQLRSLIFNTLKKGIDDFVKEYDKEHPDKPIQKVNIGLGYNRLKTQCKDFLHETELLQVPKVYEFEDAQFEQRILYRRENKSKDFTLASSKQDIKGMEQ